MIHSEKLKELITAITEELTDGLAKEELPEFQEFVELLTEYAYPEEA